MEEWRKITGSNGYEVSSLGRVRSTRNMARVLKPYDNGRGYPVVDLRYGQRRWPRAVHKIVAEVFLGPCPKGLEVGHRNNDKWDPSASNLEFTTRSANMKQAYTSGVINIAKAHKARKFFGRGFHGRFVRKPQEKIISERP